MSVRTTVSAPGKLMVMGEYAVLEGATALVMAVNRRVRIRFFSDSAPTFDHSQQGAYHSLENTTVSPEIALALTLGGGRSPGPKWTAELDTHALHDSQGRKLGLGSSAAKAVASASFMCQSTAEGQVLPLALEAHRAVAPRGSGADVAACTYGGLIAFGAGEGGAPPSVRRTSLPSTLRWRAYFSGRSASTAELITRVRDYADQDHPGYARIMRVVRDASHTFEASCASSNASACIDAVRAHQQAMCALSRDASAGIVDEQLENFSRWLPTNAAAKPAGAGGGDVSLVFYEEGCDEARLDALASQHGFTLIETQMDPEGPRFE